MAGAEPPAPAGARPDRFAAALAAIDAANADDPETLVVDGVRRPKEQAHAEAMTAWVLRLDPEADEVQLLAARAHHLRRWEHPRSAEPEGRAGYLRWRTEARRHHAALVAGLLGPLGYPADEVAAVGDLVAKRGLGRGDLPDVDGRAPSVQTHEDALCLVFLTTQLDELADRLGDDRTVDVLARTLAKMGRRGRDAAASLPFDERAARLVGAALARRSAEVGDDSPESGRPG